MRFHLAVVLLGAATLGCGRSQPTLVPSIPSSFALAAEFIAARPPQGATATERFGGLSGLAATRDEREWLAVSDDRENCRVYRLRVDWERGTVDRVGVVLLQRALGGPPALDPEGVALTRDDRLFISSEGLGNQEPRLPPAVVQYQPDGRFVRQLPVRARYAPTPRGEQTQGVRENAGFESLTLSPDERTLYTANEAPLVQDGPADAFAAAGRVRILEYVAAGGSFSPAREFAYDIEPIEPQPFDAAYAVNGIVELLSLGDGELLALERGYAEAAGRTQSINRIRLFRVSLAGATDVSSWDSLKEAGAITPVRKTLVLDVNTTAGLSERLAGLDNFEGLALGPPKRGARPLLLVSDDNFSPRQVTAFLFFRSH